jgi:acrylyl-CoA reductase (NADPH)
VAHAEVIDEEDVAVAEGTHRDVAGGPRPDARKRHERASCVTAVGAGVEPQLAGGQRAAQADERAGPRARHRQPPRIQGGERVRRREQGGHRAARAREALAVLGDQPAGGGARRRNRHLLAEHRAHRQLGAIDASRNPQARGSRHERADERIAAQVRGDGGGVGVEVQQPAAALHRRGLVARVVEPQPAVHARRREAHLGDAGPVREAQAAAVHVALDLLDAGHGARGEPSQQRAGVQRRAERQAPRAIDHRPTVPGSAIAMTVPESFPAFLATRRDDAVERGPSTIAASDLPDGEVTVRVRWSSINYKDALATIAKGQVARISPLVPGIDLAGEVVASDDAAVAVGSEVVVTGYDLGVAHHGGWAQYARVPAAWIVPLPDGLSARQAMALGTAGLTAGLCIHALEAHGLQRTSGPVLVLGASGGVGSTAVGALANAGYEVWTATGKAGEHEFLRGLGASEIIGRDEVTAEPERPLEKQRWAGVVDPIGGAGTAFALRTTQYGGAVAVCGLTAGPALDTTVLPFILRGVSLLGIDSVAAGADLRRAVWARLAGDLRPRGLDDTLVREVDLEGIEPVLDALLAGRAVGRTVVRLP